MANIDFDAPAKLYSSPPPKARNRGIKPRQFDSAARAIQFAVERLSARAKSSAVLKVGEYRYGPTEICALYQSPQYPLKRKPSKLGRGMSWLSAPRAASLLRLKTIIEAKLHDPALKPVIAAQAAGISIRYANELLAEEGTSLRRYVITRRLERCRQALMNRAHSSRTIGDIAYAHGFSHRSYFSLRFKEQLGCTPREIRAKP